MNELIECLFAIGIVIVGVLVLWALLTNPNEMHNWTEEDWIENYEGDVEDQIWE